MSTAQAALIPVDGLGDHLASLAEVFQERNPWLRNTIQQWANGLSNLYDADRREPLVGPARFRQLVDYATVQTLMARRQTSW